MKTNKSKIAGSVSLIAGLWLVLSSFLMGDGFVSNASLVGVLVTLFGLIELSNVESLSWVSWVNGILGVWLIVSPLFLTGMAMAAVWNSIILGVIITGVAIWGVVSSSSSIGIGHPKMS